MEDKSNNEDSETNEFDDLDSTTLNEDIDTDTHNVTMELSQEETSTIDRWCAISEPMPSSSKSFFSRSRKSSKTNKSFVLTELQQEALNSKIEVNKLKIEYYKKKISKLDSV